jgi:hypothetical protein
MAESLGRCKRFASQSHCIQHILLFTTKYDGNQHLWNMVGQLASHFHHRGRIHIGGLFKHGGFRHIIKHLVSGLTEPAFEKALAYLCFTWTLFFSSLHSH